MTWWQEQIQIAKKKVYDNKSDVILVLFIWFNSFCEKYQHCGQQSMSFTIAR